QIHRAWQRGSANLTTGSVAQFLPIAVPTPDRARFSINQPSSSVCLGPQNPIRNIVAMGQNTVPHLPHSGRRDIPPPEIRLAVPAGGLCAMGAAPRLVHPRQCLKTLNLSSRMSPTPI